MSYEETRKSTVIMEYLRGMEVRPIKRDERSHWDELIRQVLRLRINDPKKTY